MCTLILARDVIGSRSIVLAANRDEDPARPCSPPAVLREAPRLAGGRDLRAGGTWLAVRGGARPGVAALLNRREPAKDRAGGRRSRGLLTLDVAAAAEPREAATSAARSGDYAPCTLLWATPGECWLLVIDGASPPRIDDVAPGWHALAHAGLDDAHEPRTAWLVEQLRDVSVATAEAAWSHATELLREHGGGDTPAVCIHGGRMPTVSAARLVLTANAIRYEHAEGRPCTTPFLDYSHLFADDGFASEAP